MCGSPKEGWKGVVEGDPKVLLGLKKLVAPMLEWRLGLDPDVQISGAVPKGVWELPGDEMAGEELPRSPPPRWLEKLDPKAPEGDAGVS